jgi:hypothetical protein
VKNSAMMSDMLILVAVKINTLKQPNVFYLTSILVNESGIVFKIKRL